jgi:hypothetical protein
LGNFFDVFDSALDLVAAGNVLMLPDDVLHSSVDAQEPSPHEARTTAAPVVDNGGSGAVDVPFILISL